MISKVEHPLQSPEWAKFRKAWGNEVIETPYGIITLHKIPFLPFKVGMFIKGPTPTEQMLEYLKSFGKKNKLIFIKLEPSTPVFIDKKEVQNSYSNEITQLLRSYGAAKGKTLFTPSTFWIDLTKSEEDLLKQFSSKTRYNIKVAQKHKVRILEDNSDKAFERYLDLTRETVIRQGFFAHTEKYHKLMWKYLNKELIEKKQKPIARLLTAVYKNQIITTWIVFAYKGFLYYPYGASTFEHKNVMANNLMMWEAIKYGKNQKLTTFDLWGREPGKGFTRFKEGYNPSVVEFLGTWDLVISPLYYPYLIAEKLRWLILRLRAKFNPVKSSF